MGFTLLVFVALASTLTVPAPAEDQVPPPPHGALSSRFTETRLGPVHAALTLVDGRLLRQGRRHIALELTNLTQAPVRGTFRVLNTAAWQITPGTAFTYELGAGERLVQDFQASLPAYVSPGRYDFIVRVAVDGVELGSVRSSLMKPIDWLLVGPFEAPQPGALLLPEQGVNLDAYYDGVEGRTGWRAVPDFAFDGRGHLELDLVYGTAETPRCACAFTVVEAAATEALEWRAEGVDALWLNGRRLQGRDAVTLHKGRNTLLVRSCARGGDWRVGVTLLGSDGTWVRGLDNDLSTLLDGFEAIRRGEGWSGPAHRQWLVEYVNPNAREVRVLGSFNGWVPLDLTRSANGLWTRDLLLPPGRYAYKLSIDGQLALDPNASRTEPDGFGGHNSVLIIR